ncbi:MAG: aminotransferase class I/II-fold pyridoxal phosphate-dependent enzyme [Candidatus Heimdallarchaeota archaeon]|nr:aminotransferase class I/II-fold pyridoxal phosphate-dependent enzyme [Candidatus Heimdallarchaeota archaeon]
MKLQQDIVLTERSATLAMNELINEKRAKGEAVLHMGFGEAPFPVHSSICTALEENSDKKSYLSTQGILPLRKKIVEFYHEMFNLEVEIDQIIVAPGSKALLFATLATLEGPLFLPAPSWVSYAPQAQFLKKETHFIKTTSDVNYRLTPEVLLAALEKFGKKKDKQKLLLLNYPCNPTGQSYSKKSLKALVDVARDNNIQIISDEIYGLITFDNQQHHSIAKFYPEGTITIGGPSKDRSLGGYRLGVMIIPKDNANLMKAIISIGSEIWSCVPAPIQHAGIAAYDTHKEMQKYIRTCTTIHEIITKYVHLQLKRSNIRCPAPQGAFYLFPDWNFYQEELREKGIYTSDELVTTLLQNWNVATLPGTAFGMPPEYLALRIATVDYNGEACLKHFIQNMESAKSNPDAFIGNVAPRIKQACKQLLAFTESLLK